MNAGHIVTIGLILACTSAGLAGVTTTGSTDLPSYDPYVLDCYVGHYADGTLTVDAGSSFGDYWAYIGYGFNCAGTATVRGPGSNWINAYGFYVGFSGSGTLSILDGAQVGSLYGNGSTHNNLGYNVGSSGAVTVSGVGSNWIDNLSICVGNSGSGSLDILAGGQVSSAYGYLGYKAGSTGAVTVTGAGSKWTNSGDLYVGNDGSGTVNILAGGQVSNGICYLGYNPGSAGTAMVSGTGSKWTNNYLYVGYYGSGCVTVEDGGSIDAQTLFASFSDLHGNGTITSKGAVVDADLVFDAAHGLATSVAFGSGGTLTVRPDGMNSLGAGYKGTGTLRIADALTLASFSGYLGYQSGSTGAATITGAGSKWTINSSLYVGYDGSGSVTVADGGSVTTQTLYASLSDLHGNGTITAKGAILDADLVFDAAHRLATSVTFGSGGTLTVSPDGRGDLGAGYKGTGTLRIADAQTVASYEGYLGYHSGSAGTATITGAGSKWTNTYDLSIGFSGAGVLNIQIGGQVSDRCGYIGYKAGAVGTVTVSGTNSKWTNSSNLYIGNSGNGTMNIDVGGQVSNTNGYLGYNAGSTGTVTVSGTGSKWTNSAEVYVGYLGSGSVTVANGGSIAAQTLYASLSDLHGGGTITTSGAVLDADMVFDKTHGVSQTLVFGSGGALKLNTSATNLLGAGYKGTGTLLIAGALHVASTNGYLGFRSGSTGTATVTGAGSMWINSYDLYVGNSGCGALNIQAGGLVSNGTGHLGYNSGSSGTVTVSGMGSTWSNSKSLNIGYSGTGVMSIQAGGQVSNTYGYLGYKAGSTGTATVTGAGSKWTNSSDLYVGNDGSGTLNIQAGGQVSNTRGYVGCNSGSDGTVTVSGTGSKWTNSGLLQVGYSGSGSVTAADGGSITAQTLYASLSDLHGNGTITSKGALVDADLVFDAAHGLATSVTFGSGGTLTVSPSEGCPLGVGYKGAGTLQIASALTLASSNGYLGYHPGSTGTATVTGAGTRWTNTGDLSIGYFGAGVLSIQDGGQVSNTGGTLGYYAGSAGTVTVSGTGSKWTNSDYLYIGAGSGSVTVADGGSIAVKTLFASLSDLHGNGTITTTGAVLDADMVFDAAHGLETSATFGSGGTLTVNADGTGWLGAGYKATGTLRIADGVTVASPCGYVGYQSGSVGTVTVTGVGSKWTNSSGLYIGESGSGVLNVQEGGQVNNGTGYVGDSTGSIGKVTVSGTGSKWINNGGLNFGYYGTGLLNILAGGQVMATSMSLSNTLSTVSLHVSGNAMLVLGNTSSIGKTTNKGTINFYADTFLPAGTYTPISEYSGRAMTWSGTGSYNAYGGTWNSTAHTFNVAAPTELTAGDSTSVGSGQRLLYTDTTGHGRAGASFGTVGGGTTFSAGLMTDDELVALAAAPGFKGSALAGWDFVTNLTGATVMLSFDIGLGAQDVKVWHLSGGTWTLYAPDLLTYDSHGIVSFTVSSFSGYAVADAALLPGDADRSGLVDQDDYKLWYDNYGTGTAWAQGNFKGYGVTDQDDYKTWYDNYGAGSAGGAVPEPATLSLLALGGLAMLMRRKQ